MGAFNQRFAWYATEMETIAAQLFLFLVNSHPGFNRCIRNEAHGVDSKLNQEGGELRKVGRALAADTYLLATAFGRGSRPQQERASLVAGPNGAAAEDATVLFRRRSA